MDEDLRELIDVINCSLEAEAQNLSEGQAEKLRSDVQGLSLPATKTGAFLGRRWI